MIEIKPLSRLDLEYLLYNLVESIDNLSVDIIITKSLGYPGKIVGLAKAYEMGVENLDINPLNRKSVISFFREIHSQMPERINVLPFEYLFAIGFGLLITKYIYFGNGNLRTAYFLGGLGYLILIIWRTLKMKKY